MPSQYQHNPEYIRKHLVSTDEGGVVTTRPCAIQVPERFLDRHLASVGSETHVLGIFALIMDDKYYGTCMVDAMVRITPESSSTVSIDGDSSLNFDFAAGDQVIYSRDLVVNDTLTYYIYDELVAKGRIPWYLNYYDTAHLFESSPEHAGINLGNRAIIELILSTIARNPDKLMELYCHILEQHSDIVTRPPTYIPFRSVIWNTSDTTSKLIGGYFNDSITSALVNASTRVEAIEGLLRT